MTLLAVACTDKSKESARSGSSASKLAVVGLSIQAANAPRPDEPLVAGETVRIGLTIERGTGPYHLRVESRRTEPAAGAGPRGETDAIHADTRVQGSAQGSRRAELALAVPLRKTALSGTHRLTATATDANGATAKATVTFTLVGNDAPVHPRSNQPPLLELLDVAGRARTSFVRGETVTLRAVVPGAKDLTVTVGGPDGAALTVATKLATSNGELRMPFPVPRLARPGHYTVTVSSEGQPLSARLRVDAEPFPRLAKLTVDDLKLYAGKDGRAPRTGILRLGEHLRVDARVGGGKTEVAASLILISQAGKKLLDVEFARVRVADPAPDARMLLSGSVLLPRQPPFAPGRHRIQVEVSEGDEVSMRTREVLLQ